MLTRRRRDREDTRDYRPFSSLSETGHAQTPPSEPGPYPSADSERRGWPFPDVDKMAGDRRRRRHRGRDKMGAALKPWRPSKLRFEVEAQRSPGASRSRVHREAHRTAGLAPFRSRRPRNVASRPSASACCLTGPEPGTSMALTDPAMCFPTRRSSPRRARSSSQRPLVQEPIKTRSIAMSVIFSPPFKPM